MNTGSDLRGNINMRDIEGGVSAMGQAKQSVKEIGGSIKGMLEDKNIGKKSKIPQEFKNLNTLDEPVCETIVSHYFTLPNYCL